MHDKCSFFSEATYTFSWVATPREGWGMIYMLSHPGLRLGFDGMMFVDPFDRKECIDKMRLANIRSHIVLPPQGELPDDAFAQLEKHSNAVGVGTRWLPVADFKVPDRQAEQHWQEMLPGLIEQLKKGQSVAFSCLSGVGRSPCMAARLLFELGTQPSVAIAKVRLAVVGAIETEEQAQWVGSDINPRRISND